MEILNNTDESLFLEFQKQQGLQEQRLGPPLAIPQDPGSYCSIESSKELDDKKKLELLRNHLAIQHSAISKAQNKVDGLNHTFTPEELPQGWHSKYQCKEGVVVSLVNEIKLNASGKQVLLDTGLIDGNSVFMLHKANTVVKLFIQRYNTEIKVREGILTNLSGEIEKVEDRIRKIEASPTKPGFFKSIWNFAWNVITSIFSLLFSCFSRK